MGDAEEMTVDLGPPGRSSPTMSATAFAPAGRSVRRIEPGVTPELVSRLTADHADTIEEVYAEARVLIDEATAFTLERDLLRDLGGECRVGPAPPSRRWAMAMMSGAAPFEPDAPSWYYISPPDPEWSEADRRSWMAVFNRTTLPAITVHEVTPGHFAHARMLRLATTDVRRALQPLAFVEGWAHYVEELFAEERFRDGDPRYVAGMCVEALIRVTRLAVALGLHTGTMTLDEAVARFEDDAFLEGEAARSEAGRATYDPTYGRYTWGKLGHPRPAGPGSAAVGERLHPPSLSRGPAGPRLTRPRASWATPSYERQFAGDEAFPVKSRSCPRTTRSSAISMRGWRSPS